MTGRARIALVATAIVVAIVAYIALKPSSSSDKQSSTTTTATTAGGKKVVKTKEPKVVVRGGKPVGGIKDVTFAKGDTVRFIVDSDVADEVHVHGYDVMRDVKPGQPLQFSFPGKIDGEFVVELEGRKEQIASLKVTP